MLAISLVISQTFVGLGFLGHEILHGTVIKRAWLRDLLGSLGFVSFWVGAKLWRKWHNMEHHAHTQHVDDDPDVGMTMEQLYSQPVLRWLYRFHPSVRNFGTFIAYSVFFQVHSMRQFIKYNREFKGKDRVTVWVQLLLPLTLWISLLVWMGPVKWLFAYLIPLLIANFVTICYITSNHDLNPITEVNDPLANSLSVTVPRWVDIIHFNFSHHVEHHLYPGMSGKYAPLVRAQVREMFPGQYFEMSMLHALKLLWITPRVYKDEIEKVDMHRSLMYGTLGHGLDPVHVLAQPIELPDLATAVRNLQTRTAQGD
jgi:fatty acid desaturase